MKATSDFHALPYGEQIDRTLRAVYHRTEGGTRGGAAGEWEFVDHATPVSALLEAEVQEIAARWRAGEALHPEEMELLEECLGVGTRDEGVSEMGLLDYIFQEGPHPGKVIRRLYALAQTFKPALVLDMSREDLAILLGETRAANSKRLQMLEAYGRAAGNKGEDHRAAAKKAARNNNSRKKGTPRPPAVGAL